MRKETIFSNKMSFFSATSERTGGGSKCWRGSSSNCRSRHIVHVHLMLANALPRYLVLCTAASCNKTDNSSLRSESRAAFANIGLVKLKI